MIQRTACSTWTLGKVAAIVCMVSAGITQNAIVFCAVERHARVPVCFERELAVGADDGSAGYGAIASWASRHRDGRQ